MRTNNKPSNCVAKLTFLSQNCHVRDAHPDNSVDQRQHTLGRLLNSGVGTYVSGTARAVPLLKVGRFVMHFAVPLFGHRLHIALMMFRLCFAHGKCSRPITMRTWNTNQVYKHMKIKTQTILLNGKDFWLWTSNNYNIYLQLGNSRSHLARAS